MLNAMRLALTLAQDELEPPYEVWLNEGDGSEIFHGNVDRDFEPWPKMAAPVMGAGIVFPMMLTVRDARNRMRGCIFKPVAGTEIIEVTVGTVEMLGHGGNA